MVSFIYVLATRSFEVFTFTVKQNQDGCVSKNNLLSCKKYRINPVTLLLLFFSLNCVFYFHKYSCNYIYCAKLISSLAAQRGNFTFTRERSDYSKR